MNKTPEDRFERPGGNRRIAERAGPERGLAGRIWSFLPEFFARLKIRRDSGPIDTIDGVCRFVSTRSAFVAQKTLYGYLKTRMGTRYPAMFEDDVIIESVDIAKMHIFAACLSDLAVYAAARALQDDPAATAHADLAERCFEAGLADNEEQALRVAAFSIEEAKSAFRQRLAFVDWQAAPQGPALFTRSPVALVEWAPIAPELKRHDTEIIENSIRFTWREVRQQFERRIDGASVAAELSSLSRSGN